MQESSDPWRRRQKPDNEVPGCVVVEATLASNDDLVVFVSGVNVYRHGVELTVEARARPGRFTDGSLGSEIFGDHGRTGNRMLLGIEFADGRSCANVGSRHDERVREDPQPQLWSGGGGGDDRSASVSWFLSPLPPPGEMQIICAWPGRGLAETVTSLSADLILDAASRARELWPWAPDDQVREPVPPVVPAEGWFARRLHP